jgi:hypothetical protein
MASQSYWHDGWFHTLGVILRSSARLRAERLEGWPRASGLLPSFETRAFGALLRMTVE